MQWLALLELVSFADNNLPLLFIKVIFIFDMVMGSK